MDSNPAPLAPTDKIATAAGTGSLTLALIWVAGVFGLELPPEAAAGIILGATLAAGYLKTERAAIAALVATLLDRRAGRHAKH